MIQDWTANETHWHNRLANRFFGGDLSCILFCQVYVQFTEVCGSKTQTLSRILKLVLHSLLSARQVISSE